MQKQSSQKWIDELSRYREAYDKYTERGDKIVKRYRDERKDADNIEARFNILWSNVKTLKPAIYSRTPKPEVSRRFKDSNPVARVASTILERSLSYEIKQFGDFHGAMSNCVEDRLLSGRGTAWLRYEPITEAVEEPQITEDVEIGDEVDETAEENPLAGEEPLERITSETTPVDYVYWKDFAHLPARTWEEVTWVGRRVYLELEEGVERFGEEFRQIPLTCSPDEKDKEKASTKELKKAEIWEIWCKPTKKVYWVAPHYDYILDEKDDPLELEQFFPCPKPIYATITTGSLVPIADFVLYQDQAEEIDILTSRIQHLTKAMKVMGIYAADETAIGRLLKEGNDAVMIPVTNWAAFVEKGGLDKAIQFMPLRDVAQALQQLYVARDACKQIIYEVTGISDILRGASMASETATAQQIKSQFASIRLNDFKDDVARFAREILRMKAEIMCSKYQPETMLNASGIMYTQDAQLAPQAIELLKNEPLRNFAIDIEDDTLVQLDEQQDKQSRIEFLQASGQFLNQATQMAQQAPELLPLLGEMMMFGIRGFKVGRTMETTFENTLNQITQKQQQAAQQPQQDREMMKLQASQQLEQGKMQLEQAKMQQSVQLEQMKSQIEQAKMQIEQAKAQADVQAEQAKLALEQQKVELEQYKLQVEAEAKGRQLEFERWKAELASSTSIVTAQISAKATMDSALLSAQQAASNEVAEEVGGLEQVAQMHVEAMNKIGDAMAYPSNTAI